MVKLQWLHVYIPIILLVALTIRALFMLLKQYQHALATGRQGSTSESESTFRLSDSTKENIKSAGKLLLRFVLEGFVTTCLKAVLYTYSFLYFLLGFDKSGLPHAIEQQGKQSFGSAKERHVTKTIIFIRHGESVWNNMFHHISFNMVIRLVVSTVSELLLLPEEDSLLIDSPLSPTGIAQACKLKEIIFGRSTPSVQVGDTGNEQSVEAHTDLNAPKDLLKALRESTTSDRSTIVCSNLRRAISTSLIVFSHRIQTAGETVKVLPCLQEVGRNVDCVSILSFLSMRWMSFLERRLHNLKLSKLYSNALDNSEWNGGKHLLRNTLLDRFKFFNNWVFNTCKEDTVIVVGHSGWIRHFFSLHLKPTEVHPLKKKKISNCGIISFQLTQIQDVKTTYLIDPSSLNFMYGEFR